MEYGKIARALVPMAGLRNLLVHEYSDIEPQRLQQILHNHLSDVELFLQHLKTFLESLPRDGLTLE